MKLNKFCIPAFFVLFYLSQVIQVFSQDILTLADTFPPLREGESLVAEKFIINGEKNYTLVLFSVSQTNKKIIQIVKNAKDFKIRDNGKMLFYWTSIGSTGLPYLFKCDGNKGSISQLGRFPDFDISSDGVHLITYLPKNGKQFVGTGVLYSIVDMNEEARYDFNSSISGKYPKLTNSDYFDLGFYYNENLKSFDVLFDHYGEIGPLSCVGLIHVNNFKFEFSDRKVEVLKEMGY